MDRSEQLSKVVRKSMAQWSVFISKEMDDHLKQTVNLLYTHQDYTDHLKLPLANTLAWLPNEVIDGVLESEACGEAFYEDFANLALLNGSWADFGREFATADRRLRSSENNRNYNFAGSGTYKFTEFCDLSINRSRQLSDIVGKCLYLRETLKNPDAKRIARNDFMHLLMQTVQFMCVDQDYTDYLELNLANDFANLPNTIIADIVNTAECVQMTTSLALIQGLWAESAVGHCLFSNTNVYNSTGLVELKAKAPQFYDSITFHSGPDELCEILDLMGTRFSHVLWTEDCGRSASARILVTKFLKRQLNSSYLRSLTISGEIRTEDLNELLVEFVKRPQFEDLYMTTADPLPFEVIEEAHRTWETTEHFAVDRKWINGTISAETLKKIEEKFKPYQTYKFDKSIKLISSTTIDDPDCLEWKCKHPSLSAAEMFMNVFKNRLDQFQIKLQFSKLNDERVLS